MGEKKQYYVEKIEEFVSRHGARPIYGLMVEMLRDMFREDDLTSEEQKQLYFSITDDLFKEIGQALKDKLHCGEPVKVTAYQDFEVESIGIKISCAKCNFWSIVEMGKGPQDVIGVSEVPSADENCKPFTLRGLREIRGVSEESVAESLGISLNTLRRYELDPGRMRYGIAIKFARYYGLHLNDIDFSSRLQRPIDIGQGPQDAVGSPESLSIGGVQI